jgi:thiol-disulfide isomerase/thioredoxin
MMQFKRYKDPLCSLGVGISKSLCQWYEEHLEQKNQNNFFNTLQVKVINIDSDKLKGDEISFFENLFSESLIKHEDTFDKKFLEVFNSLLNHIPVFLVKEKTFHEYTKDSKELKEPVFEIFGYYTRLGTSFEIPAIFICYNKIVDHVNKKKLDLKHIFSMVLIHEFAHALMDCDINTDHQKSEYYQWMEESLANCITLFIAENSKNKDFFGDTKDFIKTQPDNYKVSIPLFEEKEAKEICDDCLNWWDEKDKNKKPDIKEQKAKLETLKAKLKEYEKNNP